VREKPRERLEAARFRFGPYASTTGDLYGCFRLVGPNGRKLIIMSSGTGPEADGWEHVSVSIEGRTPNWLEMCLVKDMFWADDECVVQYHPAKSEYVNYHPHCLHLWKPIGVDLPTPPRGMVGPKKEKQHVHED
jgi:hypothetical protein